MLRSRIVPCLLMHDGGLVKTRQFKDPKYVGDPLNAVKIFNEKEVDELMFLDIDASAHGREPNLALLRSLAVESRMPLCYGGGITAAAQASRIVALGFEKVSISSAALRRPDLIREMSEAIGSQSVVVTLDVRRNRLLGGYAVFTRNGQDKQKVDLVEFCQRVEALGAGEIVINSIDRDGDMGGYDLELARRVRAAVSLPMSVLGGAGSVEDMKALIEAVGIVGAAAGSMFVFKGPYRAVLINYARPERLG
ncbi:AglZ/HisF2 family acetamidino modification protein [Accumulibacter sp.]|uniref:AglZ/HisF2 family acetamidino modification protein n=1 Tax=Accumulibacter sp. TaxID=2053492 RepID=UPI0025EF63E7|nr:AglZ/HisF2 family acetamidino modification protein [Accumulibacter sp.]MCM8594241.1 AglZ/HisF2 family acetamidino modification protein [Accumulibacter sp.]MCM8625807.1 AglZ/HisF2 family acetamidino modification protein [Accumulibacter sp.]MDS4048385.1 AglZ/HisF2 family acetamidino modification protein [Accumulibacter sp.]